MLCNVLISPATEQDVADLNILVNSAYRGESSKKGWTTEADLLDGVRTEEENLRSFLKNPDVTILKYEKTGQLIGCVYLEHQGATLYLGMLTVAPTAQTNGIGKQLLQAAEELAFEKQCQTITLTVISVRDELIAWYQRRGFQPTGKTFPFPDDPRFGIKKQPLSFIEMVKNLPITNKTYL